MTEASSRRKTRKFSGKSAPLQAGGWEASRKKWSQREASWRGVQARRQTQQGKLGNKDRETQAVSLVHPSITPGQLPDTVLTLCV